MLENKQEKTYVVIEMRWLPTREPMFGFLTKLGLQSNTDFVTKSTELCVVVFFFQVVYEGKTAELKAEIPLAKSVPLDVWY